MPVDARRPRRRGPTTPWDVAATARYLEHLVGLDETDSRGHLVPRVVRLLARKGRGSSRDELLTDAVCDCERFLADAAHARHRLALADLAARLLPRARKDLAALLAAYAPVQAASDQLHRVTAELPARIGHFHDLLCLLPARAAQQLTAAVADLETIAEKLVLPHERHARAKDLLRKTVAHKLRRAGLSYAEIARALDPDGFERHKDDATERIRKLLRRLERAGA
jgi:hypothetical protein